VRVTFLNQYFPPDRAATAQLLGQLAGDLAARFEVAVVCGTPTYAPDPFSAPPSPRLEIHRVPLIPLSRRFLAGRILNYLLFLAGAALKTMTSPRPDVIVCWTDPPLAGLLGVLVKLVKGSRFLFVSQDVYPEMVSAAGKMDNPVSRWILGAAGRLILRKADAVVVLGEDMKGRLVRKGCPISKLTVIPNWQDLDLLKPAPYGAFRLLHGIPEDALVVMHSGNIGFSQDFETLLAAAERLKNAPDIHFLIVGDGARLPWIRAQVRDRVLTHVKILPYQSAAALSDSLSAADLHYVSLKPAFLGLIVPSKIYAILAVGRSILLNVPDGCDLLPVVREAGSGFILPPDGEALARKILEMKEHREELERMGWSGRNWAEKSGGRERATAAYTRVIESLSRGRL
jgi:glycosyltransferase involved in cell wall biosynthesis